MKVKGNILFKEEQHFRVQWLWWLVIFCMISSVVGIILGIAMAEKEKMKEAWVALAIVIPLEAVILYLMYISKLETVVSSEGLFYKWYPFQRSFRFIHFGEIEKAELREGPVLSYGYSWVPGYGRVHNTGPGKGIQLKLKNGKRIFIGTQKQNAFQSAVDRIRNVPKRM